MWASYTRALGKWPLATKVATGTTLATTSDLTAQAMTSGDAWNPRRTLGLATFGCVYSGFFQHFLFGAYARVWPVIAVSASMKLQSALKVTGTHQLFTIPFIYFPSFFLVTDVVGRGSSLREVFARYVNETLPIYKPALVIWTPAMFLQFFFVPVQLQVLWISSLSFLWTAFMSWSVCGDKAAISEKQESTQTASPLRERD
jgi:hypothetical protein